MTSGLPQNPHKDRILARLIRGHHRPMVSGRIAIGDVPGRAIRDKKRRIVGIAVDEDPITLAASARVVLVGVSNQVELVDLVPPLRDIRRIRVRNCT